MSEENIDELFEAERKPKRSSLEVWIGNLDARAQERFAAARKDPEITNAGIGRILVKLGRPTGKDTIAKWRDG